MTTLQFLAAAFFGGAIASVPWLYRCSRWERMAYAAATVGANSEREAWERGLRSLDKADQDLVRSSVGRST